MNYLLKYDTQHVRVFCSDNKFIKFSHFEDSLLVLANYLFASSSTLKISSNQIKKLQSFIFTLSKKKYILEINFIDSQIIFTFKINDNIYQTSLCPDRIKFWKNNFQNLSNIFSVSDQFQISHSGSDAVLSFFAEININIADIDGVLKVYYPNDFFFIPFEFIYNYCFVKIYIKSQKILGNSQINSAFIMYDPDLELSYEESLYVMKLLEKRNFSWNKKTCDLLLISAHGTIQDDISSLENRILEDFINRYSPKIVIFNSCVLGQQTQGIVQNFLNKGSVVIVSPFYALCSKTIFAPLLRMLYKSSGEDVWISFQLLRIFYPNIYKYFRIYIPYKIKTPI